MIAYLVVLHISFDAEVQRICVTQEMQNSGLENPRDVTPGPMFFSRRTGAKETSVREMLALQCLSDWLGITQQSYLASRFPFILKDTWSETVK